MSCYVFAVRYAQPGIGQIRPPHSADKIAQQLSLDPPFHMIRHALSEIVCHCAHDMRAIFSAWLHIVIYQIQNNLMQRYLAGSFIILHPAPADQYVQFRFMILCAAVFTKPFFRNADIAQKRQASHHLFLFCRKPG